MYLSTAQWNDSNVNVDAVSAALPAWSLAQRGTIELSAIDLENPWLVDTPQGRFSNRPVGTYLLAVPAYLAVGDPNQFSTDPSTATAALTTAAAMTLVFLILTRMFPLSTAVAATLVAAFGTATWTISSRQLWPHGPGQLTAAVAVLSLATGRYMSAGSAFAGGVLVRLPTALFPATLGLGMLRGGRKAVRPLITLGLWAITAVVVVLLYNQRIFGRMSLSGGYSGDFTERLVGMSAPEYGANLVAMFFGPANGLFFWSPIVLVSLLAAFDARPAMPRWARLSALAGLAYLFVHARMNRASGGLPFNYRYPLEGLVMAAPYLVAGANAWYHRGSWRRTTVVVGAGVSLLMQAVFQFMLRCEPHTASEVLCSLRL